MCAGGITQKIVDRNLHQATIGFGAVDNPANAVSIRYILRNYLRISAMTIVAIKVHVHYTGVIDTGRAVVDDLQGIANVVNSASIRFMSRAPYRPAGEIGAVDVEAYSPIHHDIPISRHMVVTNMFSRWCQM